MVNMSYCALMLSVTTVSLETSKSPSEGIRAFSQQLLSLVAVSALLGQCHLQIILVFFLVEMFSIMTSC